MILRKIPCLCYEVTAPKGTLHSLCEFTNKNKKFCFYYFLSKLHHKKKHMSSIYGIKHIMTLGAQSAVDQATAITALNVLVAAQIVVVEAALSGENSSSVMCMGFSTGVAVGPIFTCAIVLNYMSNS